MTLDLNRDDYIKLVHVTDTHFTLTFTLVKVIMGLPQFEEWCSTALPLLW